MPATSPRRDGLVTGEAVLLDLRPASFAVRMLSGAIDGALQIGLMIAGSITVVTLGELLGLDDGLLIAGLLIANLGAFLGYPILCEMLLRGRSVGRLIVGTRVVREDGGQPHFRQSLLRAVMAMFEIWATSGTVALTCAVIDPRSRRVGDLLAGTMVLQERMRDRSDERREVPSHLADWAVRADVGRLPLELAQDIRRFLPRAATMNTASRRDLSRALVQRTLPFVAPAPPPGTDPEAFLQAVIAERSRRDEETLRRRRQASDELVEQVHTVPFQH